jgi:hypothetical protein
VANYPVLRQHLENVVRIDGVADSA